MRLRTRGGTALRTVGVAITVAGLGLLSFGTLTAHADTDGPLSTKASVSDRDASSAKLTDKITYNGPGVVGAPNVKLYRGDCKSDETADTLVKDPVTVNAGSEENTWTTDAVTVGMGDGDAQFHFDVSITVGSENGQVLTTCEDVTVPAKPDPTPTPAPTATPTPAPTAAPTPTPTAAPTATPLSTTTSSVKAVAVVKTPSTGVDVSFGLGGVLLASGLGFLAAGARRRRAGM